MGNRGVQAVLVIVVLVLGVAAALAVGNGRKPQTAGRTPAPTASASGDASPSPSASPSESPSESPSASPSPSAAPSAAPSESPSAAPRPAPPPPPAGNGGSAGSGPAAYPPQLTAGTSYSYRGTGTLVAHATDSLDSGSSVCAGINENTQSFPAADQGVFFVGVTFPDHQILAAGYIRRNGRRADFASIQNDDGSGRAGHTGADPGAGSHNYCVTRSGSAWVMTRDGSQLYSTTREAASDLHGAELKFDNDVGPTVEGAAGVPTTLVVPGFHDITVGGQAPRQLRGATFYL